MPIILEDDLYANVLPECKYTFNCGKDFESTEKKHNENEAKCAQAILKCRVDPYCTRPILYSKFEALSYGPLFYNI